MGMERPLPVVPGIADGLARPGAMMKIDYFHSNDGHGAIALTQNAAIGEWRAGANGQTAYCKRRTVGRDAILRSSVKVSSPARE